VAKIASGFHHNIFLTVTNELFALGLNNHGQCGVSNLSHRSLENFTKIFVNMDKSDEIIGISAGKSHSSFITCNF